MSIPCRAGEADDDAPLVSVVIPAYNAEAFLERTLRSALRQTYRRIEVIVINDGSNDRTGELALAAASEDERVRVINVPNGGTSTARNLGIEHSQGPFIAFLDADDVWHPLKLELQLAALTDAAPQAAAAYALHRCIDTEDRVLLEPFGFNCTGYTFARHLYGKVVGNGSSLLVRREVALAAGGFDPSWTVRPCEDLDFELKIMARYPIVAVPHYLVGYRIHATSASANRWRMARSMVSVVEKHLRQNPELPRWAAAKVRAATREGALHLLIRARRWRDAAAAYLHLLWNDPARAADFAVQRIREKIEKARGAPQKPLLRPGTVHFEELGIDPVPQLHRNAARRDVIEMQRLAEVDRRLAARVGVGGG